jgi:hypothetical protein
MMVEDSMPPSELSVEHQNVQRTVRTVRRNGTDRPRVRRIS